MFYKLVITFLFFFLSSTRAHPPEKGQSNGAQPPPPPKEGTWSSQLWDTYIGKDIKYRIGSRFNIYQLNSTYSEHERIAKEHSDFFEHPVVVEWLQEGQDYLDELELKIAKEVKDNPSLRALAKPYKVFLLETLEGYGLPKKSKAESFDELWAINQVKEKWKLRDLDELNGEPTLKRKFFQEVERMKAESKNKSVKVNRNLTPVEFEKFKKKLLEAFADHIEQSMREFFVYFAENVPGFHIGLGVHHDEKILVSDPLGNKPNFKHEASMVKKHYGSIKIDAATSIYNTGTKEASQALSNAEFIFHLGPNRTLEVQAKPLGKNNFSEIQFLHTYNSDGLLLTPLVNYHTILESPDHPTKYNLKLYYLRNFYSKKREIEKINKVFDTISGASNMDELRNGINELSEEHFGKQ